MKKFLLYFEIKQNDYINSYKEENDLTDTGKITSLFA